MSTPIAEIINKVSNYYSVPKEIAEDMVQETQSVMIAFLVGERDDYDDLGEIVYDYLSLDTDAVQILLDDLEEKQ